MSETGLQYLLTDTIAIDKNIEDSKTGTHPYRRTYLFVILHFRKEPACTFCSKAVLGVIYDQIHHRSIRSGYPFSRRPGKGIQSLYRLAGSIS